MHTLRHHAAAMFLCLLVCGCVAPQWSSESGPFPADWTAYALTTEQAQARWDAYWKRAFTLAGSDSDSVAEYKRDQVEWQKRWAAFIGQMQSGDELWYFSTPRSSWAALAGREGYAILRHGQRIDSYIVSMN